MQIWEKISDAVTEFDTKDWVIVSVGAAALLLSIIALFRRTGGRRWALRQQLTDLFIQLTDLNTESARTRAGIGEYPLTYLDLLNDKRRFLVRQAAYIARRIGGLVSPYERVLLAQSFADIHDHFQADRFFKSATRAGQGNARGLSALAYARYFFNEGRGAEGRQYYQRAVKSFKGNSDRARAYRAHIYEDWAQRERDLGDLTEGDRLHEAARHELEGLKNSTRREAELKRLQPIPVTSSAPVSQPSQAPPQPAPETGPQYATLSEPRESDETLTEVPARETVEPEIHQQPRSSEPS